MSLVDRITTEAEREELKQGGDIGSARRKVFFAAFSDAMTVCGRPSFGILKEARATFRSEDGRLVRISLGVVNTLAWRRELGRTDPEALRSLVKIEKYWPEVGWEQCWPE